MYRSMAVCDALWSAQKRRRFAESNRWPVATDQFMQAAGDLAQRAVLDRIDQLAEHVAALLNYSREPVQRAFGMRSMPTFEVVQAVELPLLLCSRSAN